MKTAELHDGIIEVVIKGREPFDLDIYTAKLALEEFEVRHGVYETKDWKITAATCLDLQETFTKVGAPFISGAVAVELWSHINTIWEDVKKNWSFMPTSPTNTESVLTDCEEGSL